MYVWNAVLTTCLYYKSWQLVTTDDFAASTPAEAIDAWISQVSFGCDECGSSSWTISPLVGAIHTHRGMTFISRFKEISEDHAEMYDYVYSDCHGDWPRVVQQQGRSKNSEHTVQQVYGGLQSQWKMYSSWKVDLNRTQGAFRTSKSIFKLSRDEYVTCLISYCHWAAVFLEAKGNPCKRFILNSYCIEQEQKKITMEINIEDIMEKNPWIRIFLGKIIVTQLISTLFNSVWCSWIIK